MFTAKAAREQFADHGLAAAVIALAVISLFWLPDIFQIGIALVALAVGLLLRPRHVWVVWTMVVLAVALVVATFAVVNYQLPKSTDDTTTLGALLFAAAMFIPYLGVVAMLPLWLSRFLAAALDRRRDPRVPASGV